MTKSADTHCPYCALQCAMTLKSPAALTPAVQPGSDPVPARSRVPWRPALEVSGRDFPTNRGGLCRKGWTSASLLHHPGRVTEPLLKGSDGVHRPIAWDEALALITTAVKDTRAQYGADAVGVFGGGGLTNEKAYQLGKFARLALGTSRIDYNGRFCMSSAAAAGMRAFGLDRGLPFPLEDLDTRQHHPDARLQRRRDHAARSSSTCRASRDAGGLIVVDPRRSATAAFTSDGGGLHLQPLPGTDLALLLGLSHVVIHEGLADAGYIEARTTGYDAVVRSVNAFWPERVQSITGVPAELIRETARGWPTAHARAAATSSPAAASNSTSTAPTPPPPPSTSASCWACPAPPAAATARSPARATARAAANTARRPTSSPATARSPIPPRAPTWPRSGVCPSR